MAKVVTVDITEVRRGDVVRFKSHELRVEAEPERRGSSVRIEGKWFMKGRRVEVERAA